jgi:hypothetical protein
MGCTSQTGAAMDAKRVYYDGFLDGVLADVDFELGRS